MIERKTKRTARIGTFAVTHAKYWEQFEGLLDNIMGYHGDFVTKLSQNEVEVINYGMVHFFSRAQIYAFGHKNANK